MKRTIDSRHYFVIAARQVSPSPQPVSLEDEYRAVHYNHRVLFNRITQALQDKPCRSLAELSRELQVSRRTIQNAVKAISGKKFRDLRENVLLERVIRTLASAPNAAIKDVAFKVGYRSPRAFARAVRRACGLSPEQLRSRFALELVAYKN